MIIKYYTFVYFLFKKKIFCVIFLFIDKNNFLYINYKRPMWNKIIDPKTGKEISLTSAKGKQILYKYIHTMAINQQGGKSNLKKKINKLKGNLKTQKNKARDNMNVMLNLPLDKLLTVIGVASRKIQPGVTMIEKGVKKGARKSAQLVVKTKKNISKYTKAGLKNSLRISAKAAKKVSKMLKTGTHKLKCVVVPKKCKKSPKKSPKKSLKKSLKK